MRKTLASSQRIAQVVLLALAAWARAADVKIVTSSYLGGAGDDDSVVGCRIQSDGTIVLAVNLSGPLPPAIKPAASAGNAGAGAFVLRLSPDGQKILSQLGLPGEARDLAIDEKDNLYVAAGSGGFAKLDPKAARILWSRQGADPCLRIDAAGDGHCAILASGKNSTISIFDSSGKQLGSSSGRSFTNDVCIDGASKTACFVGFRNARAHDGKRMEPVQISYMQAIGYDGSKKWCNYDWSTDQKSDRFVNKSGNNMADTRGYRCAIGRDGLLYAAFESAGGNHIFYYSPTSITERLKFAGGDQYHQFHASAAEHKTVFGRYEPATGKVLGMQQFCGRTERGRANATRMKEGDIAAAQGGVTCLAGLAGASIPITPDLCAADEPKGGPYMLAMSGDLTTRLACLRMQSKGSAHCLDVRTGVGKTTIVYGGSGAEAGMHSHLPVQKTLGGTKDAFIVVLEVR
jgi:hypothetical protein